MNHLKRLLFYCIAALVVITVSFGITNFFGSITAEKFTGYIPVDVMPKTEWFESVSLMYDSKTTIDVVIGNDTVNASFNEKGFFGGSDILIHKDSYPPAIGKIVYVRGYKDDNQYFIEEASLVSFDSFGKTDAKNDSIFSKELEKPWETHKVNEGKKPPVYN